jgi:hypothetical protein
VQIWLTSLFLVSVLKRKSLRPGGGICALQQLKDGGTDQIARSIFQIKMLIPEEITLENETESPVMGAERRVMEAETCVIEAECRVMNAEGRVI